MSTFFKKIFKWSLLITLPIACLYFFWIQGVADRYWNFGVRYGTYHNSAKLLKIGKLEFDHLFRKAQLYMAPTVNESPNKITQVSIFLSESSEDKLNKNLPHSGREYVKGRLLHPDGKIRNAKMKYRGDFFWHWGGPKKSIRIKTKKKRLYKGIRQVNLIVPKFKGIVHDYLSYDLASRFGLLTPVCEPVNLSVNGENRGVYFLVEQMEEMVLRKNGRMPGDLYAGEILARDKYTGIEDRLFKFPRLWEKKAVNNHFAEDSYAPLSSLCELVSKPQDENSAAELRDIVDLQAFGKFAAFRLLTQSFHYDNTHNWRLYYDPWRNVFEPVVWDPVGWNPGWLPRANRGVNFDIISSEFDHVLSMDYQFLLARQEAFEDFFASDSQEDFWAEVERTIETVTPSIERDPSLVFVFQMYPTNVILKEMDKLKGDVKTIFDDIYRAYITDDNELTYSVRNEENGVSRLQLIVDGRRPVSNLQINYSRPIETITSAQIYFWKKDKKVTKDISGAVRISGSSIEIEANLLARFEKDLRPIKDSLMKSVLKVEPAYYELLIDGVGQDNNVLEVLVQRGRAHPVRAQQVDTLEKIPFSEGFGIVLAQPRRTPEIWQGEVYIKGVRQVQSDLIIMPGTVVTMAADASVIIEGRLVADGLPEKPITVKAAENKPWGTFALRGKKANGSVVNYCNFSNGSGYKGDLFEYSAMFSIHDVQGVKVSNSTFKDSHIVDDMVHIVYSDVRFENNQFLRAKSDALDIDISNAVVKNCLFKESGNDALDLMTSKVVVFGSSMIENSDKGISVGEGTTLLAVDNRLLRNGIGIQVKDSSQCTLYNTDFIGNKKAVDAYKKNWRYGGGGTVRLYKAYFAENMSNLTVDKKSKILVYDSFIDGDVEPQKRIIVDSTVDSINKRQSKVNKKWLYPEDVNSDTELFSPYWQLIKPAQRGAYSALTQ